MKIQDFHFPIYFTFYILLERILMFSHIEDDIVIRVKFDVILNVRRPVTFCYIMLYIGTICSIVLFLSCGFCYRSFDALPYFGNCVVS